MRTPTTNRKNARVMNAVCLVAAGLLVAGAGAVVVTGQVDLDELVPRPEFPTREVRADCIATYSHWPFVDIDPDECA